MYRTAYSHGISAVAALLLAACGGGSPDDGARLDPAAQRAPSDAAAPGPPALSSGSMEAMGAPAAEGVAEGEAQPAVDAIPPVAPHPTRLVILDDGLYARDAGDNWKRYENGSWVSVHAPPMPPETQ